MKELIARVTRKGQVTIPAGFRRAHEIREGSRVSFSSDHDRLILKPVPSLEDLAGADSNKIDYAEAIKSLDQMRSKDRY